MDKASSSSGAPTRTIVRRPDGELVTVCGINRSGKTLFAMREASASPRLIAWDSHFDYMGHGAQPIESIPELARACRTRESAHLAYIGPADREHFEEFCRVALCWLKLERCAIVVEELADVSVAGKAPRAWGELIRWTPKLGGRLYAITQRPQESDKTIFGNSARVVVHAILDQDDAAYVAKRTGIPLDQILALKRERLEYLERMPDRSIRPGRHRRPAR